MEPERLKKLLADVKRGRVGVDRAVKKLAHLPFADIEIAKLDFQRSIRHGIPEVVFGLGKQVSELERIIRSMQKQKMNVMVTRLAPEKARVLLRKFKGAKYNSRAQLLKIIQS